MFTSKVIPSNYDIIKIQLDLIGVIFCCRNKPEWENTNEVFFYVDNLAFINLNTTQWALCT